MELPTVVENGTDLDLTGKNIRERMKGFETSVQSLVTLEPQLDSIDEPPPYQKIRRDRVIISVTGSVTGPLVVGRERDFVSA